MNEENFKQLCDKALLLINGVSEEVFILEERMQIIQAAGNSKIQIGVIPGHYATNHSHINYYVDITSLKTGYFYGE